MPFFDIDGVRKKVPFNSMVMRAESHDLWLLMQKRVSPSLRHIWVAVPSWTSKTDKPGLGNFYIFGILLE
jgi:hypothetical protein